MKLLIKNILAFLLLWNINITAMHDFHMSYGESTLTDKYFKGKITFYKNDFFEALKNFNSASTKNFSRKDYDKLKKSYLENHFRVIINGSYKPDLQITTNNEDDASIWFNFIFRSAEEIHLIKIIFNPLFNEYNGQMNILNIMTPEGEESKIFKESQSEYELKI